MYLYSIYIIIYYYYFECTIINNNYVIFSSIAGYIYLPPVSPVTRLRAAAAAVLATDFMYYCFHLFDIYILHTHHTWLISLSLIQNNCLGPSFPTTGLCKDRNHPHARHMHSKSSSKVFSSFWVTHLMSNCLYEWNVQGSVTSGTQKNTTCAMRHCFM